MAGARQIPDLSPSDSYGTAAAKVVAVRTEEVFERHQQVLAVEDIEALHDMRVATRRLRAALEVFEPCFPRHAYRRALRDVKRLADALGERRDRDVQIEWLERYAGARRGEERSAVLGLVERLRSEQASANEALAEVLGQARRDDLKHRLQELASRAITGSHPETQPPARDARSENAWRRGNRHGRPGAAPTGSDAALAAGRRR
jgi:CHAD domain-containing protein